MADIQLNGAVSGVRSTPYTPAANGSLFVSIDGVFNGAEVYLDIAIAGVTVGPNGIRQPKAWTKLGIDPITVTADMSLTFYVHGGDGATSINLGVSAI